MIRLQEEIKTTKGAKFITLTFSNQSIKALHQTIMHNPENWGLKGYELDNKIATLAMRLFNERYRKKTGKALRHWTVTELGHEGTDNIHLHGIIWPGNFKNNKKYKGRAVTMEDIEDIWTYGWVWKYKLEGQRKINYVNAKTVNYCTKYVSKRDEKYIHYKQIVLCSPGIGKNYTKTFDAKQNKFNGTKTNETYRSSTGHKMSLPKYWRNKIYSDQERETLWLQSLDKQTTWVAGIRVDLKKGNKELFELRQEYRRKNRRLGYGSYHKDQDRLQWEENKRAEKFMIRIRNAETNASPAGSNQKG